MKKSRRIIAIMLGMVLAITSASVSEVSVAQAGEYPDGDARNTWSSMPTSTTPPTIGSYITINGGSWPVVASNNYYAISNIGNSSCWAGADYDTALKSSMKAWNEQYGEPYLKQTIIGVDEYGCGVYVHSASFDTDISNSNTRLSIENDGSFYSLDLSCLTDEARLKGQGFSNDDVCIIMLTSIVPNPEEVWQACKTAKSQGYDSIVKLSNCEVSYEYDGSDGTYEEWAIHLY